MVRLCQRGGEMLALIDARKPSGNRGIICRRGGIGLGGKLAAERQRGCPPGLRQFIDQCGIVGRIGNDRHKGMVLGRRSHHRGATDVDIFNRFITAGTARNRRLERVEIDHHQIDRADRVGLHRGHMFGIVAHCQQSAVNDGVQRLDPAIHHFGKAGQFGNVAYRQTRFAQGLGRAAC